MELHSGNNFVIKYSNELFHEHWHDEKLCCLLNCCFLAGSSQTFLLIFSCIFFAAVKGSANVGSTQVRSESAESVLVCICDAQDQSWCTAMHALAQIMMSIQHHVIKGEGSLRGGVGGEFVQCFGGEKICCLFYLCPWCH